MDGEPRLLRERVEPGEEPLGVVGVLREELHQLLAERSRLVAVHRRGPPRGGRPAACIETRGKTRSSVSGASKAAPTWYGCAPSGPASTRTTRAVASRSPSRTVRS